MLKVLLHGRCSYDCAYCRIRTDCSGLSFAPAEIAHTFPALHADNRVRGLFPSSGIPHGMTS